ncbi:5-formyltetrahydrofolate cyclo-ligase [Nocardia transvalensis]|uniref:5-formyltetrahydrofolate cyclo-ligase n=1 Tax=Nocardia transvalensis TaxID=37333 RepID=A0A7W9PJR1_9NOCA|nr:5-formyltetrahydrofolate cyclo-ligase [Nocardia transvalensis]MBB5916993.1 5-formyltetrahydrofolate cyclo-ligase [Nocardia transvalensis]
MSVDQAKQAVRQDMWSLLKYERAVPVGAPCNIPDFDGAAAAADRLAGLPAWTSARVVTTVPDTAQLPVRLRALTAGKLIYMAVPRLAEPKPFYLLDPDRLPVPPAEAARKDTAARVARNVEVDEMLPVDLVVLGSVAVNRRGVRLGKGAGYSDIEIALLHEVGLIDDHTTIATTVHELQVLDHDLPEADHDCRVDLVVTPDSVIHCDEPRRPPGLRWDSLTAEKIAAIPALAARYALR